MKRLVFGIFAHPDDAAFGPSGTLHLAVKNGADVHLVCATRGGGGTNPDNLDDLAAVREAEEKHAAELIGVSSLEFLGYEDGQLCNRTYLEIANKVIEHIRSVTNSYDDSVEITLITFDPNGLTGHIDHITMAQIATYAYLKLRDDYTIKLKYFCLDEGASPAANTNWIYMPKGRSQAEIDEQIDASSVKDQKIAIIKAHHSQRHDGETHLARGEALFTEHFLFYKD